MTEKSLESILHEKRQFPPSAEFTAKARLKPADVEAMRAKAAEDYEGYCRPLDAVYDEAVEFRPAKKVQSEARRGASEVGNEAGHVVEGEHGIPRLDRRRPFLL